LIFIFNKIKIVNYIYYKIQYVYGGLILEHVEKTQLYTDALYWHFINLGYSEWRAKAEAEKITGKRDPDLL